MIFFKQSLIILSVTIWFTPVTSDSDLKKLRGMKKFIDT